MTIIKIKYHIKTLKYKSKRQYQNYLLILDLHSTIVFKAKYASLDMLTELSFAYWTRTKTILIFPRGQPDLMEKVDEYI